MSDVRFVASDPSKCVGCGSCVAACAAIKEGRYNPLRSRIVLAPEGERPQSTACRFCHAAPCRFACPNRALSQDKETDMVTIDADKCQTVGWCTNLCPYGAITVLPEGKAVVCGLCGGEPGCIPHCPTGALNLVTAEQFNKWS
jgi:Fe-S-cluster-containing hydrogenase component 2